MYKQLSYLKDSVNQTYIGVKFTKDELFEALTVWESIFNKNISNIFVNFIIFDYIGIPIKTLL